MMTEEQFEENLALYGANLDMWPAEKADQGKKLLLVLPTLAALQADYSALDEQLVMITDDLPVSIQDRQESVKESLLLQFEEQQLLQPRTLLGSFMTVAASVVFAIMLALNSSQNEAVAWEEEYIDFALGFAVEEAVYNQPETFDEEGE